MNQKLALVCAAALLLIADVEQAWSQEQCRMLNGAVTPSLKTYLAPADGFVIFDVFPYSSVAYPDTQRADRGYVPSIDDFRKFFFSSFTESEADQISLKKTDAFLRSIGTEYINGFEWSAIFIPDRIEMDIKKSKWDIEDEIKKFQNPDKETSDFLRDKTTFVAEINEMEGRIEYTQRLIAGMLQEVSLQSLIASKSPYLSDPTLNAFKALGGFSALLDWTRQANDLKARLSVVESALVEKISAADASMHEDSVVRLDRLIENFRDEMARIRAMQPVCESACFVDEIKVPVRSRVRVVKGENVASISYDLESAKIDIFIPEEPIRDYSDAISEMISEGRINVYWSEAKMGPFFSLYGGKATTVDGQNFRELSTSSANLVALDNGAYRISLTAWPLNSETMMDVFEKFDGSVNSQFVLGGYAADGEFKCVK